jgi:DNA-binding PadR family transcriptional regulator
MDTRASFPPSGDITRIVLLGLLSQRPMHGYAVHRVIEERHMDEWADIKPASIYAALQRLEREGLIEEAGTTRDGRRPPGTVYRTTSAGVDELQRLLRQAWTQPLRRAAPADVALSFYQLLDPDEVVALLETRLEALAGLDAHVRLSEQTYETRAHFDRLPQAVRAKVADIWDHHRRLLDAERGWTEAVLARARAGAYAIDAEELRRFQQESESSGHGQDRPAPLVAGIGASAPSKEPEQ